jgi:hypothetical protein
MKHFLVIALLLAVLVIVGCGTGAASTTTLAVATTASPTTTAVPTTSTTLPTTTTTTAAPTTTTLSEAVKVAQYGAAMGAWLVAFGNWTDTLVETPDDVTTLTDADIQRDQAALTQLHSFSDQLHAIEAPAAVAAVHQKVVDGFDVLVTLTEEGTAAEVSRDQAAYDGASAEVDKVSTALMTALEEWQTAVQGALPTPSPAPGPTASAPAAAFAGTTLQGTEVSLESYRGKPLVLVFWWSG